MKKEYDPDADALSLYIREGEVDRTIELDENTLIDVDKDGNLLSIEVLFVKERKPKILEDLNIKLVAQV